MLLGVTIVLTVLIFPLAIWMNIRGWRVFRERGFRGYLSWVYSHEPERVVHSALPSPIRASRLAKARKRAEDDESGCVACGSQSLELSGERLLCLDCGYEGRADRGGELSDVELGAAYSPEQERLP